MICEQNYGYGKDKAGVLEKKKILRKGRKMMEEKG
jgi:hypothetical protein